jgi:dipeptidyl-peptidase 4
MSYDVLSPSGKYVVYNESTLQRPPEAVIRTTDGKSARVFERADASALLATGYQPPRSLTLTAADGKSSLWGVLYEPRDLDLHKHYPVIDAQYDSPLTAVVPHNFMSAIKVPVSPQPAMLAKEGFAVVVIDARGTTYRSKAFSNGMQGKLDTMNLDDHIAAIRELAGSRPWFDIDRVGVIGGSYGGWVTFRAMLRFGDFYKVGIAMVPPGGFHSMYLDYHWTAFQGDPIYADGSNHRTTASEFPSNWNGLDNSPEAERLQGKLLIIMGALDENAIPGSTMQFINALMKANKDFNLIFEPQANHYSTPNAYAVGRSVAFLKQNLGGPQ